MSELYANKNTNKITRRGIQYRFEPLTSVIFQNIVNDQKPISLNDNAM